MPKGKVICRMFLAVASVGVLTVSSALGDAGHGTPGGQPGNPSEVARTIEIQAKDMAFDPDAIAVKDGETVRFVIRNTGETMHDFTIGTPEVQARHRQEMMTMMEAGETHEGTMSDGMMHGGMTNSGHSHVGGRGQPAAMHDDPNAVLVAPGETKELIWRFSKTDHLEFGCNIPGHHEANMKGIFRFVD